MKLNIQEKIAVLYASGCMEIMGGWKNIIINGWVRHNSGLDLKMVRQKILNKTSTFWPNAPKILSKCIPELPWQNWRKIHFLLHFHARSLSNNSFEWIIFFMWCIYILSFKLFKSWSSWSKALLNFFLFLCFEWKTIITIWIIVSLLLMWSVNKLFLKMAVCKAASR